MENLHFINLILRNIKLVPINLSPSLYITTIKSKFNNYRGLSYLAVEIEKARKGKDLLTVFSTGSITRAEYLLKQEELNPNCWQRNQDGKIETPLNLIIDLCRQGITNSKKEILTKLLKHKALDFSQVRPISEIGSELKKIIDQALKERLKGVINSNDLDDVKRLVEDNPLIDYAIVIDVLRDTNSMTKPIRSYLNEKFVARSAAAQLTYVVDEINNDSILAMELQQFEDIKGKLKNIKDQLEITKKKLANKEQELTRVRQNLNSNVSRLEQDLRQDKVNTALNDVTSDQLEVASKLNI
ncbi:hypothetical protein [Wolbachia endosymbiont of Pentidionis agamae]|uniref:hypothetical protein n=1 Tax=Wolbachia endosymbiont of Pentidionis agamae TaxID=3110435 RepID=UPI002FD00B50